MTPDGYVLSSLELVLRTSGAAMSDLTVTLRDASGNDPDSMVLATFVNPDSPALGATVQTFRFTLSEGEDLDPDTPYFIHLNNSADSSLGVATTNSDDQDSGSLSDWGIDDTGRLFDLGFPNFGWFDSSLSTVVQIQLDGYAKTPAPVLGTAEVNGDELVLTYGEALDATSVPAAAAFTVTVGGAAVSVSTVTVSGVAVTLGLASAAAAGQTVLLDYVVPSSNPLQNGSGSDAVALTGQAVENRTLAAPLAPTVSAVSGQSDRLTVSWMAPSDGGSAITDYDVQYCQGAATACTTDANFTEHAFTGTTTEATIGMLMASTEHQVQVRATNAEGTGPWSESGAGTTASASDGGILVSNTGQSRVGAGFTILRLNNIAQGFRTGMTPDGYVLSALELLLVTAGAAMSDLTVTLRNASGDDPDSTVLATFVNPDSPALSTTVERTFRFTLSEDEELDPDTPYFIHLNNNHATDDMGVARTPSGNQDSGGLNDWGIDDIAREQQSGDWIDIFGNLAVSIRLDGYAKPPAPVLSTAEVNGDELVLTYGEALDATSVPAAAAFTVTAGGVAVSVSSVSVSGMAVTLGLASAVTAGQTVLLDYVVPSSNPLQNGSGSDTVALAGQAVLNRTTAAPQVPSAPLAPTVSAVSGQSDRLSVSWTAPSDGGFAITDYDVRYCQGAVAACTADTDFSEHAFTGTATAATIAVLMAATEHQVQVRATNAEGAGPWSASGAGTTAAPQVPSTPLAPTVSAVSGQSDRLSVSWTAPSDGGSAITDYDVRYCQGAVAACTADTDFSEHAFTGTATAATIATLMAATEYQVQVRATNAEGAGPWSASGAGSTAAPQVPSTPLAPTVSAVSGQSDRLSVSWTAPSDGGSAITDYDVRYCRGAAAACTTFADFTEHAFTGTATSTTIAMLMAATEYQVQVRATNAEGAGPWSASGAGSTETPMLTARLVGDAIDVYLVEGDELELTVRLSGAPGRQVAIPLFDRGLFGASSGSDYTGVPSSLTFGATETERSFTVTAVDNSGIDLNLRIVAVEFDTPAPSGIVLPPRGGVAPAGRRDIHLVDNDFLYQASYQPSQSYSAGEASGALTVTVRLQTPGVISSESLLALDETVTVLVSSTDGTATAGEDYTALSGLTLSFASTDFADDGSSASAEKAVTVSITDDAVHEGAMPETFTLALSHDSGQRVEYVPSSGGETATVSITDDDAGPPSAPLAPTVSAVSGASDRLSVSWTAPADGGSAITGYDVRYCRGAATACTTETNFTEHVFTGTATATTIVMLMAVSEHQVQVRATNAEGDGPWSASGAGITAAVPAPLWSATMLVGESAQGRRGYHSPPGFENIGYGNLSGREFTYENFDYTITEISVATGGINLVYRSNPDRFFGLNGKFLEIAGHAVESRGVQHGQTIFGQSPSELINPGYLTTLVPGERVLVCLRMPTQTCPSVAAAPSAPLAPLAPTVSAVGREIDRLSVSWAIPPDGGTAITDYDVRYCRGAAAACTTGTSFTEHAFTGTATSTTIAMLMEATEYQVQVRATNGSGTGPWSALGAGTTPALLPPIWSATMLVGESERSQPTRLLDAGQAPKTLTSAICQEENSPTTASTTRSTELSVTTGADTL